MADIRFYHLTRMPIEKALPRLLEKALAQETRAVVLAADETDMDLFNKAFWEYHPASFLPHGSRKDGQAERQPVYITDREENPNGAALLCVASGKIPIFHKVFEGVIDIFDGRDDAQVQEARKRWKAYKEGGHALRYFRQKEDGSWEQAG